MLLKHAMERDVMAAAMTKTAVKFSPGNMPVSNIGLLARLKGILLGTPQKGLPRPYGYDQNDISWVVDQGARSLQNQGKTSIPGLNLPQEFKDVMMASYKKVAPDITASFAKHNPETFINSMAAMPGYASRFSRPNL